MFGSMQGILGSLLGKMDFIEIAKKILPLVPDGQGTKAMDCALNIAKSGAKRSDDIMDALEKLVPGSKEKIEQIPLAKQIWNGLRGKSQEETIEYGKNVLKSLSVLKNNGNSA